MYDLNGLFNAIFDKATQIHTISPYYKEYENLLNKLKERKFVEAILGLKDESLDYLKNAYTSAVKKLDESIDTLMKTEDEDEKIAEPKIVTTTNKLNSLRR